MILFVCNSTREAAALTTICDHRAWTAYGCTTIREFRLLSEKLHPRVVVVRHRLIDGYSDDVFSAYREAPSIGRPKTIVLMPADRSAQSEARQIALGADCALHDPVRMEILMEYLAKYRLPVEVPSKGPVGAKGSFSIAGVEIYPSEHRMTRGKLSHQIAPQEVALLRILSEFTDEVVSYSVMYAELFGRRFDGDTSNCRVLLCKVLASFQLVGINLRPFIQVIPKSGYLYSAKPARDGLARLHCKSRGKSSQRKKDFKRLGNQYLRDR